MDNFFLRAISKTIDLVTTGKLSQDETTRIGKSDLRWVESKTRSFNANKANKGDIYQFDFGKNAEPEMSYEHRGLVIGKSGQLLYVLPIYSYLSAKHTDIYDASNKPMGNLFLLKASENSFLTHDSVLKLNDIRTVSTKRILFKHNNGSIDPNSERYKKIEELVFSKYFPTLNYELNTLRKNK